jgi:hypothetical protein
MAKHYSPRKNALRKKRKGPGRPVGIGDDSNSGSCKRSAYDLCAPMWAVVVVGGLAAYGVLRVMKR